MQQKPIDEKTPRNKVGLISTIVLLLVCILLLVALISPLRDIVFNHFLAVAPSPTPTVPLAPGDDVIAIHASPPGTVAIDGRSVVLSPQQDRTYYASSTLRLSRGQHRVIWQAPPFLPISCIVFVPPVRPDLCSAESRQNATDPALGRLIAFNASLADLPDTQRTALEQTIQATLDTLQSSDTVQPGEHYLFAPSGGEATVKTATQPLKATLSFHLDDNLSSQNVCSNYGDTCTYQGQNCLQLCSSPLYAGLPVAGAQLTWDSMGLFYPTWTYKTLSGQVVAQNQPDADGTAAGEDHTLYFRITWDGAKWHASTRIFPESISQQFSGAPACDSITNEVGNTPQYSTTNSGQKVTWGFAAAMNEAAGCLALVVPAPASQIESPNFKQPAAYFLYRFGVLLAANALAHSEFPTVPMANAYEQSIARSIAAKLQF